MASTTLTSLTFLDKAQALIVTPETWCKGPLARDAKGKPIHPADGKACKFCSYGALIQAELNYGLAPGTGLVQGAINALNAALPTDFEGPFKTPLLTDYNDARETTHADVMALFERAKAIAENGGAS